ncbi:MAG: hypothetical protein AAGI17_03600 [Planctomycetota bacterium]
MNRFSTTIRRCLHSSVRVIAAGAVAASVSASAFGQVVRIEDSVVTSTTLGPADISAVEAYVQAHSAGLLETDDLAAQRRAVRQLIEPLERGGVSVSFRNSYAQALQPLLDSLIAGPGTPVAWRQVTALRLSAELATERTARIINRSFDDSSTEVRYFAIYAAGRVFAAAGRSSPAIIPQTARTLSDELADIVASSDDPVFADAAVRSLRAGGSVGTGGSIEGFPAYAINKLAEGGRERAIGLELGAIDEPSELNVLLRAGGVIREANIGPGPADAAAQSAGFAGGLFALVLDRVETNVRAGNRGGFDERDPAVLLASLAETILGFASDRMAAANRGSAINVPAIRDQMLAGDLDEVRTEILGLIGPGGRLTQAPYSIPASGLSR